MTRKLFDPTPEMNQVLRQAGSLVKDESLGATAELAPSPAPWHCKARVGVANGFNRDQARHEHIFKQSHKQTN